MKDKLKSCKGITMVALSITIAVMIILATVLTVEFAGDQEIVEEVEQIREITENDQNEISNEIKGINDDWGIVLSQNKIENEVGSR